MPAALRARTGKSTNMNKYALLDPIRASSVLAEEATSAALPESDRIEAVADACEPPPLVDVDEVVGTLGLLLAPEQATEIRVLATSIIGDRRWPAAHKARVFSRMKACNDANEAALRSPDLAGDSSSALPLLLPRLPVVPISEVARARCCGRGRRHYLRLLTIQTAPAALSA